jgi:hypothetical protein
MLTSSGSWRRYQHVVDHWDFDHLFERLLIDVHEIVDAGIDDEIAVDGQDSAQETSGPIIANGKIVSGRGCEYKATPNGCVITAHDGKTGKELWRTEL